MSSRAGSSIDPHGSDTTRGSHENKVHPSEYLEFATLPNTITGGRVQPLHIKIESEAETPSNITQSNDDLFHGLSQAIPNLRRLSIEARAATKAEHKMGFLEGLRTYPKAIMWSVMLSSTIIMEGFDLTLINSFFAFPVFRRHYGQEHIINGNPQYQITPAWQSGLTNAAVAGEIIGLMLNGFLTDRFGYHRTMVITLVWMALFVFLAFFAVNIQMLLVAQVMCGLPWGIFQTLSTTYAAEVMPVVLRSYLTSNVNLCWLIGQLIGCGVVRALVHNTSEWSYRIPFGLQWAFAVPILVGVCFAPESPWWLIRHDKPEAAKKALARLTSVREGDFNADETISMMIHTNEVERYLNGGGVSYQDCFKTAPDRRRTEIACMVWITQAMCGSALTGYAAYFYEAAGFDTANSFNLACGMYGIAIFGHLMSWFWMRRVGRRTLYLTGLVLSLIILIAAGVVGTIRETAGTSWTLGSMIIVLTGVYDATIGPVCYVLVAEIPSSRLRVKTVVLARVAYNIVSIATNIVTPRMLNPAAWDWAGKSCYLYAGTTLVCLIWCWFRLPEPFGLTYLELDILFEKRAKTGKFREFQVNLANSGYFSLTSQGRAASVGTVGGVGGESARASRAGSRADWVGIGR
jgi:MFS transporter, SP family, general alpha glucoside:H+ symporter